MQLLRELKRTNQLEEHQRKVEENKIYDRLEEKYIARERLKKELGMILVNSADDYESSGSDS